MVTTKSPVWHGPPPPRGGKNKNGSSADRDVSSPKPVDAPPKTKAEPKTVSKPEPKNLDPSLVDKPTERVLHPDAFEVYGHMWRAADADAFACPFGYELAYETFMSIKEHPGE